jgi:hypothetical protein
MKKYYHHPLIMLLGAHLWGVDGTCNLCGEHPIPINGLLQKRHGIRCRDLFDQTSLMEDGSFECSRVQLTAFQTGCCNELYVPDSICSVCPDGSPFHTSISIPGAMGRRTMTCADIPTESSFFDFFTTPGECSDTFLQRSAAWCKCPGHQVQCHLCPNGAAPTDLQKKERVLYGWTCEHFQYITALLNQGECVVSQQLLEIDAGAFCCEGVEPPNACQFCPDGQQVVHPDRTISTSYGEVACGDIEETLRMVPTEESCDDIKRSFSPEQCCGLPLEKSSADSTKSITKGACLIAFLTGVYNLF